ncbi:4'-phosphopantetheinyl transferase family protein [Marinicellulosiphila megalodicopiae]|uniref:4'-phosphopantetheinyl transferase family protein n=1 Tax=Marinicellulosiphila megalodicopiae TaxID=2724896 RepID=UPI003BB0DB7A
MTNAFITNVELIKHHSHKNLVHYKVKYDIENYSILLFDVLKILLPTHIQQSVKKRQAEYLAGRYAAKLTLEVLGVYNFDIKTDALRAPIWPDLILGSITHTHNTAMCIANMQSDFIGIGVDLEPLIDPQIIANIQNQIIFANDFFILKQHPKLQTQKIFTLIYSIKESFFKAAYPSTLHYFDFDAVEISELNLDNQSFCLVLKNNLNDILVKDSVHAGFFNEMEDGVYSIVCL